MRCLTVFFLYILSFCSAFGADTIFTYTLTESPAPYISLKDSIEVFLDPQGLLTIEEALQLPSQKFTRPDLNLEIEAPYVVWSRIQLTNQTSRRWNDYFHFCNGADSIWMYTIENGQIIDQELSGAAIRPSLKSLLSQKSFLPFSVDPDKERIYYFKIYFRKSVSPDHWSELFTEPGTHLVNLFLERYAVQSFYAGIMMLFCLVSLFMYGMFRERVFIYFASLMFFFTLYFLMIYGIIESLFIYNYQSQSLIIQRIFITGIVGSMFLFVSNYIRLREQFPRYFRFYLSFSVFTALFAHVFLVLIPNGYLLNKINNFILLFWIIATMIPLFPLVRKKDKSALILLISIVILFVSSFIFILGVMHIIPLEGIVKYGIQIGTILFSGIVFYGLFDKINTIRDEKRRFEELDQLKSRFFANISHEFRTPLTLVMGPIQQVLQEEEKPKNQHLLQLAHRNAGRLLQLINQLLDLSKLEAGKMELKIQEYNFALLLKGIVMSFESLADRKNIRLHFVSQHEQIPLFVDKDKVEQIFYNLLSNAFKFTKEYGEVSVMVAERDQEIEVLIRDNGIGIPASRLPYIFNRFYQVDSSETREQEGTGIGLALVRELIHLHSGTIRVESTEEKGTRFTIALPKGKAHFKDADISLTQESGQTKNDIPERLDLAFAANPMEVDALTEDSDNRDLPTVLIVEDNADVRMYIRQHLEPTFQILEAVNGQEGIDRALEHQPELVISDVMMPLKDGYEVCRTLKTDPRTSHIPVILLTAKAAQEEKMKGLETGADDYLVKPFDTRELEIRVRNLIEIRRQLRQRFAEATAFEPQAIAVNAVDQDFLEKVGTIVETHLADEQFSVEMLAEEMGMSRVHLNRKLNALTDESANKFIRSFRLQRAHQLLEQQEGNVSEIAFATGFSSTAYFVKCFGDKYGKTPGTFL